MLFPSLRNDTIFSKLYIAHVTMLLVCRAHLRHRHHIRLPKKLTEIHLFSFDEWIDFEIRDLNKEQKDRLGFRWLVAVVESFAQKRTSARTASALPPCPKISAASASAASRDRR